MEVAGKLPYKLLFKAGIKTFFLKIAISAWNAFLYRIVKINQGVFGPFDMRGGDFHAELL
jgi:hypothetical protein